MVNSIAFELVNACLNDTDKIGMLYEKVNNIDINAFEVALKNAIEFVINAISAITKFKGNKHKSEKNNIFHSKFQILSMISTTFKEMYDDEEYVTFNVEWKEKEKILIQNMRQYYVYDIITNYWSDGGTAKIHSAAKPNRYMQPISGRTWSVELDRFFEKSLQRSESEKIANPKREEYVLLNCIYLKTFSALDQLSDLKFDVEHIATKDQMKSLIKGCKGQGLPISCIANLCYLPEYDNRSKGKYNFYQDKAYKKKIDIQEIERKYSFTTESDLIWMNSDFSNKEDFDILKGEYEKFLAKRFDILKQKFCEALRIEYVNLSDFQEENKGIVDDGEEWIDIMDDYDFSGKKIICVQIGDKKIRTKNSVNAYCIVHRFLYEIDRQAYVEGGFHWFSNRTESKIIDPYMIDKNAYIEKNKNNNEKIKTIKAILAVMKEKQKIRFKIDIGEDNGDLDSGKIEFDISDIESYRKVPVGRMAYCLFKSAVESGIVSDEEIELLKTKKYTHELFKFTHYPVFSDAVDAHKGNSDIKRYRKSPIYYKDQIIFVTTQWFDGNRDDIINWYKRHEEKGEDKKCK